MLDCELHIFNPVPTLIWLLCGGQNYCWMKPQKTQTCHRQTTRISNSCIYIYIHFVYMLPMFERRISRYI